MGEQPLLPLEAGFTWEAIGYETKAISLAKRYRSGLETEATFMYCIHSCGARAHGLGGVRRGGRGGWGNGIGVMVVEGQARQVRFRACLYCLLALYGVACAALCGVRADACVR